jgi:hypothetical protein
MPTVTDRAIHEMMSTELITQAVIQEGFTLVLTKNGVRCEVGDLKSVGCYEPLGDEQSLLTALRKVYKWAFNEEWR